MFLFSSNVLSLQVATTLRNMGRQHKELLCRLEDAEKLLLYAKAVAFKHCALEEFLGKAQSRSRYWERKVEEGFEKAAGVEK